MPYTRLKLALLKLLLLSRLAMAFTVLMNVVSLYFSLASVSLLSGVFTIALKKRIAWSTSVTALFPLSIFSINLFKSLTTGFPISIPYTRLKFALLILSARLATLVTVERNFASTYVSSASVSLLSGVFTIALKRRIV